MSHHFDSPTAIEDGRINLCDVYAFDSGAEHSSLVLTVNPDAGRSTLTTLRPDALYEFVVASDAGTVEDRAWRMTVGEPAADGRQQLTIHYAAGPASRTSVEGALLGEGYRGEPIALAAGGTAWFGIVADPFWADGIALGGFVAVGTHQPLRSRTPTQGERMAPADHRDIPALAELFGLRQHAPEKRVS